MRNDICRSRERPQRPLKIDHYGLVGHMFLPGGSSSAGRPVAALDRSTRVSRNSLGGISAGPKLKGSIFQLLCRRLLPRLGHKQTIWAVAHKLCRQIWMILHKGVRYEELGPAGSERSKRVRTNRMMRILRKLGYQVEPPIIQLGALG